MSRLGPIPLLFAGAALAAACGGVLPTLDQLPPPTAPCLTHAGPKIVVSGVQTAQYDVRGHIPDSAVIDATTASWTAVDDYPVLLGGGNAWCFNGGTIVGLWPDSDTWQELHGTTAVEITGGDGTLIEHMQIHNYGDGLSYKITSTRWTARAVHFSHIRDDCIENDFLQTALVDDSFFEGCYSGFSARQDGPQYYGVVDGHNNVWTIQNSLMWLEPMQQPYKGPAPNTSGFFKWDNSAYNASPKLILKNNVFRADMVPSDEDLCLDPIQHTIESTNNVIVWLGPGDYPCQPIPPGWTLTTDRAVWDQAVADWKNRHPGL